MKNKRRSKGQVWLKRIKNKLFGAKRDFAILSLFYSSGIRLAELVGLNMQDIDFDRGIVKVLGKGSREREATLTVEAIKVLQAYLKARKNWKGCKGEAVFLSREGKRITRMNIQRNIVRYGKLAGIAKKVMPHMLRHSVATHYLNNGMDIRKVQDFLGHESLASTQVYTHLITDDQREERNRLHPQSKMKVKLI
ncbi:Tyrosine recombinase XerD [subsurface metagenome]